MKVAARFLTSVVLVMCLCNTGCTNTDKLTFFNYGLNPNPGAAAPKDPNKPPAANDALAINFANSMEIIMRCNATGSRITRDVSATAQIGLAAFSGVGAAFNYGTTTLTALGKR